MGGDRGTVESRHTRPDGHRRRVVGPWFHADSSQGVLVVSAVLWSAAFALHVRGNTRFLMSPRPDGKEG